MSLASAAPTPVSVRAWQAGALAFGTTMMIFVSGTVVLHSIVFLFGGAVHPLTTLLAVSGAVGWLWWVRRDAPRRQRLLITGAFLTGLAVALAIAAATVDVTWDGNAYHKLAIGQLRAGWNPVFSAAEQFNDEAATVRLFPDTWLWVEHYPKASWIFGAALAQIFGYIELSKAFGILIMLALGGLALGYFCPRLGQLRGAVIACLLAVNPVGAAQIFSNYVDGALGNLMLVAMLILTMQLDPGWKAPPWWSVAQWPTLAGALIVLANLKFTGLLYAGIIGTAYLAALALRYRERRREVIGLTVVGVISGLIAVAVVGASSYVRNWVTAGHPLAPLFGERTADVLEIGGEPEYVKGLDRISAFIIANLSSSSSDGSSTGLKVPFTFTLDELRMFNWVDVRIAGYGVLFGGILVVSVLVAALALARARSRAVPYVLPYALPLVVILVNVLLIDGSWWARYVPELCVVPLLATVALWGSGDGRWTKWFGAIVLALTAVNVLWIVAAQSRQQVIEWQNQPLRDQIVAAGDCNAVYPGTMFTGLAYNAVDLVPGVRVLTPDEYDALGPEAFIEATPRVWKVHPLLIRTTC